MTYREFYSAIASLEGASVELQQFANAAIAKLDKRNADRSTKPTKAQTENEPLYPQVLAMLSSTEPMLTTAVANAMGVNSQKANGLLGNLFKAGKVTKVDVSVKGKGKQRGWLLVS